VFYEASSPAMHYSNFTKVNGVLGALLHHAWLDLVNVLHTKIKRTAQP